MYIDYGEFQRIRGASNMDGKEFPRYEFRARRILDRATCGRVGRMAAVPDAVKHLMAELIHIEFTCAASLSGERSVKSFNNDGYSETYSDAMTQEKVEEREQALIVDYLDGEVDDAGTPLLYLGVG